MTARSLWSRLTSWVLRRPPEPVEVAVLSPKRTRPRTNRARFTVTALEIPPGSRWREPYTGTDDDVEALKSDLETTFRRAHAAILAGEEPS